jgi:hypothetical protein
MGSAGPHMQQSILELSLWNLQSNLLYTKRKKKAMLSESDGFPDTEDMGRTDHRGGDPGNNYHMPTPNDERSQTPYICVYEVHTYIQK